MFYENWPRCDALKRASDHRYGLISEDIQHAYSNSLFKLIHVLIELIKCAYKYMKFIRSSTLASLTSSAIRKSIEFPELQSFLLILHLDRCVGHPVLFLIIKRDFMDSECGCNPCGVIAWLCSSNPIMLSFSLYVCGDQQGGLARAVRPDQRWPWEIRRDAILSSSL
jgi:hypothetical protein